MDYSVRCTCPCSTSFTTSNCIDSVSWKLWSFRTWFQWRDRLHLCSSSCLSVIMCIDSGPIAECVHVSGSCVPPSHHLVTRRQDVWCQWWWCRLHGCWYVEERGDLSCCLVVYSLLEVPHFFRDVHLVMHIDVEVSHLTHRHYLSVAAYSPLNPSSFKTEVFPEPFLIPVDKLPLLSNVGHPWPLPGS